MAKDMIPFNRAARTGNESRYIEEAIERGHLAADGPFSRKAVDWLETQLDARVLLVHSCTAALEMAAILANIGPGDEVIMPSFTFVSTANAFALRGATIVFADIDPDTLNIDPNEVEELMTPRTRAIVPVHYAGSACKIDDLVGLAKEWDVRVIEDAAQGLLSTTAGTPLGSLGDLGAISFHETKNVTCGQGGALVINDESLLEHAEILRDKGTDRSRFERGEIDKYTWRDLGSSYALSEVNAAFLLAQLESAEELTSQRLKLWDRYREALSPLEERGYLRLLKIPPYTEHNGHLFCLRVGSQSERELLLRYLRSQGVGAVFHYVPLHLSPGGERYGQQKRSLMQTEEAASTLVRLPMWVGLTEEQQDRVIGAVRKFFG